MLNSIYFIKNKFCIVIILLLVLLTMVFVNKLSKTSFNESKIITTIVDSKSYFYYTFDEKSTFKINKIYALVFYGRRAQATILLRYLVNNLKVNGGVLDKIVFAVKTKDEADLSYLESILSQNKTYFEKIIFSANKRYREVYDQMQDDDLIFKIDDDIVFISNGTFERMLEEYINNNLLFLSANVVNHPLLSHVHARMRAILPYFEFPVNSWSVADNTTNLDTSECSFGDYGPFSKWWSNGKCAAIVHENFHEHARRNKFDSYDFKKWDFHQMGYERWSINFVLMRGKYANKMKIMLPNFDDDEVAISLEIPKKYGKHCYALGSAIVVHFSYFTQASYLNKTDLLKRYDNLSKKYLNII